MSGMGPGVLHFNRFCEVASTPGTSGPEKSSWRRDDGEAALGGEEPLQCSRQGLAWTSAFLKEEPHRPAEPRVTVPALACLDAH